MVAENRESTPPRDAGHEPIGIGSELAAGHYRIEEKIGEGGFGVVYKALEKGGAVRRYVAIKVIGDEHLGRDAESKRRALNRLRAEAYLIGQLDHPNIIRVYFDGSVGDQHFFVMEYRDGARSLAAVGRAAQEAGDHIPLSLIKEYFLQVTAGLRAIHRLPGVFHRDIKLENILLSETPDGPVIKILDFGIAHNPELPLTQTGNLMGTSAYLPFEAHACDEHGKPLQLDHRADLYALGAALYKLVTFVFPFDSVQAAYAPAIKPRPPSALRPIPTELERIILRLLEKDRQQRYQSCDELYEDLARLDPEAPALSAAAPEMGEDLPSIQLSGIFHRTGAREAAQNLAEGQIGLDALEAAGNKNRVEGVALEGAAADYAKALRDRTHNHRAFNPRDRAVLIGLVVAMLALPALYYQRRNSQQEPAATALPPRVMAEHRTGVSAQDILRDASGSRTEFIERSPDRSRAQADTKTTIMPTPPTTSAASGGVGRISPSRAGSGRRRVERRSSIAAVQTAAPVSPAEAATDVPIAAKRRSLVDIDQFHSSRLERLDRGAENRQEERSAEGTNALGIPSATFAPAVLQNGVSSDRPGTLAVATLPHGVTVNGRRLLPPGTKIVGKATYQERAGQWYVEIFFDRLAVPAETRERRVSAIATSSGQAGVPGRVSKKDQRDESSLGTAVLGTVKKALRDEPASDLTDPFVRDRADDLRELRRGGVVVQLVRNHTFQVQFTQAL